MYMGVFYGNMPEHETQQDEIEAEIRKTVTPLANKYGVVMVANAMKNILIDWNQE